MDSDSGCLGVIFKIIGYALVIGFFLSLIGIVLFITALSMLGGSIASGFSGAVSTFKSCFTGINDEVDNKFMRVLLYIVVGLAALVVAAPLVAIIVMLCLSF